jgi:hypothetical protein
MNEAFYRWKNRSELTIRVNSHYHIHQTRLASLFVNYFFLNLNVVALNLLKDSSWLSYSFEVVSLFLHQIVVVKNQNLAFHVNSDFVANKIKIRWQLSLSRLVAEKIDTPVVKWMHQEIVTKFALFNCEQNFANACQMLYRNNLAVY